MSWCTKEDVLKDLGTVNGRRTGAENLDQHVVRGDLPPPRVYETIDKEELNYFTGGYSMGGQLKEPDLCGISAMLKIVNAENEDNEPATIYCDRATDEIRISKLNPLAGEYIPPKLKSPNRPQYQRGSPNKRQIHHAYVKPNLPETMNGNVSVGFNGGNSHTKVAATTPEHAPLKFGSSMFKPRSAKENIGQNATEHKAPRPKSPDNSKTAIPTHSPPQTQPKKAEEIKEIQQKIKTTILASSSDNSLQAKRQKNVAIAALLKLGSISQAVNEQPVKLMKPEYFENPPTKKDLDIQNGTPVNAKAEELVVPSTSSSEMDLNYIEQDSISKVTDWLNNRKCPKPRHVPQPKPVLKESVTFKKKETSSASSKTSETTKEKQEQVKSVSKAISFKPSSYASDLLKKYESNAQKAAPLREELGEMLERQLKERDEVIRQKMLARENAG